MLKHYPHLAVKREGRQDSRHWMRAALAEKHQRVKLAVALSVCMGRVVEATAASRICIGIQVQGEGLVQSCENGFWGSGRNLGLKSILY